MPGLPIWPASHSVDLSHLLEGFVIGLCFSITSALMRSLT
jgi:hypothetical protein